MADHTSLRDHACTLRHDAIRHGHVLFFDPIPLLVLLAHEMTDETIFGCIEHALDDGYGDPDDLDPEDERQTSRLEAAIMETAESFSIEELVTIEYAGWPGGFQDTLCAAEIGEAALLVVHRSHDLPAFHAVAAGPVSALLEELHLNPEALLPRLEVESDKIIQVVIRRTLTLSVEDVLQVVLALTGRSIGACHILRRDLLLGVRP